MTLAFAATLMGLGLGVPSWPGSSVSAAPSS